MQIWDTASNEGFRPITKNYYSGANGIILMYDITNRKTFDEMKKFLNDIKQNSKNNQCIILVGSKLDLEYERTITYQEGEEFAKKYNMKFIEISSKNCINVDETFNLLIEDLLEKQIQIQNNKSKKTLNDESKTIIEKKNQEKNREVFMNNRRINCLYKYELY